MGINQFQLQQSYPNPFNLETVIGYSLARPSGVQLIIYNYLGQIVRTLVNGQKPAGEYRVVWDGKDEHSAVLSSGVFIYRMEYDGQTVQKKCY